MEPGVKGTLLTVTKDEATGLSYGIYLLKYRGKSWIASYDISHDLIVQVQEAELSAERVPDNVRHLVMEWLA